MNVHRLPRRPAISDEDRAPDAIIMRFVKFAEREKVLRAFYTYNAAQSKKRAGAGTTASAARGAADKDDPLFRVSIRTDLPRPMKIKRSQLATKAFELRKQGFLTRIRVVGTDVILQTKRFHSGEDWKRYSHET